MAQYQGAPMMFVPTGMQGVPVNGGQVVVPGNAGHRFISNNVPIPPVTTIPSQHPVPVATVPMPVPNAVPATYCNQYIPQSNGMVRVQPVQQQQPTQFQHPAPYYPPAPAPVPQPAPAQQPAFFYQPTNVPVPQAAPMQQQTGYCSPAIPVTGSPQRIIRPAQVPVPMVGQTTPVQIQSPTFSGSPSYTPSPPHMPSPPVPQYRPVLGRQPLSPVSSVSNPKPPYVPRPVVHLSPQPRASSAPMQLSSVLPTSHKTNLEPKTPANANKAKTISQERVENTPDREGSPMSEGSGYSEYIPEQVDSAAATKENLHRQFAEILRQQNGLPIACKEFRDLENTMSLEERDIIDTDADGSVKTFLSQSPMFVIAQSDKVFLNLRQYLVQRFCSVIDFYGALEATDERILNVFINLKTDERKLIMSTGSLKNFLIQSERVTVDGNTIYPRRTSSTTNLKSRDDWDEWGDTESPTGYTGNVQQNGDDIWGDEEDQMFEQQSFSSETVGQTPPVRPSYSREHSEEPVSYSEPDWGSEEDRQKWLKEREEKSAKFEEIARKRGIQIVDPKTLENDDVVIEEEYEEEESDECEVNVEDVEDEKDDDDDWVATVSPETEIKPALTDQRPLSSVIASLAVPDQSASPIHEVARKIVLQVFENLNKLSETKVRPDTLEIAGSNVISAEGGEQGAKPIHETQEVSKASEEESRETEDSVTEESEQKVTGSVVFESKLNPSVPEFKLSASAPVFELSAKAPAFKPSSESHTPKETSSPAEIRMAEDSAITFGDFTQEEVSRITELSTDIQASFAGQVERYMPSAPVEPINHQFEENAQGTMPFFLNWNPEKPGGNGPQNTWSQPQSSTSQFRSLIDKIGVPEIVPRSFQRQQNDREAPPRFRKDKPSSFLVHRGAQTFTPEMCETAVNTKRVRQREGVVQTEEGARDTRDVWINTSETIAEEDSEYFVMPTTIEKVSVETNTDRKKTSNRKVQVGHTFCHVSRDQQTMTEKNDFVDMVDRLEYDEMEYRAIQAEEQVLWLQLQMCLSELLRHSAEVELRQQQQIRLFAHSNAESRRVVEADYRMNMDAIKTEMERIEALYDANLAALRDGKRLSEVRGISFTYPPMTPTRFNLGSARDFRFRSVYCQEWTEVTSTMKSETFSATHRTTMQPPNLQQNTESSVWSRAPPVNRAPQPAPARRDKPLSNPMVLSEQRTRHTSVQSANSSEKSLGPPGVSIPKERSANVPPPRKVVPSVKIVKKKRPVTTSNDGSSDKSSQASKEAKSNLQDEDAISNPSQPPGLSGGATAAQSAEPPSGLSNVNVIEIADPTPHLKEIIVKMLKMKPDLQRTPQMLQLLSVDHMLQLQQNGLVRLTAAAQQTLNDLSAQTRKLMAPQAVQGDLEAQILRQSEEKMNTVGASTGVQQVPRAETGDNNMSVRNETRNGWKNSRLKKNHEPDKDDLKDSAGQAGFGAKFKTVSTVKSESVTSVTSDSNQDKLMRSIMSLPERRLSTGQDSRSQSGSEASKSMSRESSSLSSSPVPDCWDDGLDEEEPIKPARKPESQQVKPPENQSRASVSETAMSSWSGGCPSSVKEKPKEPESNVPPRLQKKTQQAEAEKSAVGTGVRSLKGRPLPVVASSISAVEVTKGALAGKGDSYKPQMGTVLVGKMKKVGGTPRKSSDSPSPPFNPAEYQSPEPDRDNVTLPKAAPGNIPSDEEDAAVLKDKRPVSEISDIDVMDEVIEGEGCKENQGEETMNLQEDEWHKVGKNGKQGGHNATFEEMLCDQVCKKSKGQERTGTFDRMISKILERFPELTRDHAMTALGVVRNRRGTLKNATLTQLLAEVDDVLNLGLVRSEDDTIACKPSNLLWKTAICQHWKAGQCTQGADCPYAHGQSELRQLPKFSLCSKFLKGECPHPSSKCIYAHGNKELRPMPEWMKRSLGPKVSTVATSMTAPEASAEGNVNWFDSETAVEAMTPLYMQQSVGAVSADGTWDDDGDACPVCFEDMNENKTNLDCGHEFHETCIRRWVMGQERTCPMCRQYALLPDEFPKLGS